jgi:hypothetical protein
MTRPIETLIDALEPLIEQLAQLARRHPKTVGPWSGWLHRLLVERGAALHDAIGSGWRSAQFTLPAEA